MEYNRRPQNNGGAPTHQPQKGGGMRPQQPRQGQQPRPQQPRQGQQPRPQPPRQGQPPHPQPPRQGQPLRPQQPRQGQPRPQPKPNPPKRPPQPPRSPEDNRRLREADRAAKRAMEEKTEPRRKRRRGGNYSIYWLMALGAFVVVFVILANTVLFNCASIEIVGTVRYTDDEVISASGLSVGDNLLHINKGKSADKILKALDFIDTAKVEKIYPTGLKITVGEAEKWFLVCKDGNSSVVSRNGKIIEMADYPNLVRVYGFEPIDITAGSWLQSAVEGKNDIPAEILSAADKIGFGKLTEIDLTDRFAITAKCGENITLEFGNISSIESKLSIAKQLIATEVVPGAEVIIRLSDPDKVAIKPVNNEPYIPLEPTAEPSETAESAEAPEAPAE